MSIELKIKAKSLAEEALIIRKEERKLYNQIDWHRGNGTVIDHNLPELQTFRSIKLHRKWNVRNEQRATQIARAYLEGRPYRSVEPSVRDRFFFDRYIFDRVLSMVGRYGPEKLYKRAADPRWKEGTGWKKLEETLKKWLTSQEF
jgi:hypothetical protein